MFKNYQIQYATTLSKRYASQNFSNSTRLCVGSYIHDDSIEDQYKIIMKFDILEDTHGLLCFDKILLRLHNFYNPSEAPQVLNFYSVESSLAISDYTWNNCPDLPTNGVSYSVSLGELEHKNIDIDITPILRTGLCAIDHTITLIIASDYASENSVIYFDSVSSDSESSPSLKIDYSSALAPYGLLVNETFTQTSSDVLDIGRLYMGSYIAVKDTSYPNPVKVIEFQSPGIYELNLALHSSSQLDGYFYFKKGNSSLTIDEFTLVNHIDFTAIHGDTFTLSISIEDSYSEIAVLYSGDHTLIDSLTISTKRISIEDLIRVEGSTNPFTGGNLSDVDYTVYAMDSYCPMYLGTSATRTTLSGTLTITGDISAGSNDIFIENIESYGNIIIDIGEGNVYLSNCYITSLTILSCGYSNDGLNISEDCYIDTININNLTHVKLSTDSSQSLNTLSRASSYPAKIVSITITTDAADFLDSEVILHGDFGKSNILIDRSAVLTLSSFNSIAPVEVNLNDHYKTLYLQGSLGTSSLNINNSITVHGESDFSNGEINIQNGSSINIDGNFSSTPINLLVQSSVTVNEYSHLKELKVSASSEYSIISIEENASIDSLSVISNAVLSGDSDYVLPVIANTELLREDSTLTYDSSEDIETLINASGELDRFFLSEISSDLSSTDLESLLESISQSISVNFVSISYPQSVLSPLLELSSDFSTVVYSPSNVNLEYIYNHEAVLSTTLSLNSSSIDKNFFLKGKYSNLSIDYILEQASIGNSLSHLQYCISYEKITDVVLYEDFVQPDYSMIIPNKTLYFDLSGYTLNINNIYIYDSNFHIKNGIISPNWNTDNWKLISNTSGDYNRVFCYMKEYTLKSDISFDSITISGSSSHIVYSNNYSGYFTLFQGGCCTDTYPLEHFNFSNSTISLENSNSNSYVENNFCALATYAKETHFESNIISCFNKIFHLGSAAKEIDTICKISDNTLNSCGSDNVTALEIVPYDTLSFSSIFLNGEEITPNLSKAEMVSKILSLSSNLSHSVTNLFSKNIFTDGCYLLLWQNQNHEEYEKLQYQNDEWTHLSTSIIIYGKDHINMLTKPHETLQMIYSTTPSDSVISPTWSVDDETKASISSDGILTAINNGIITVYLKDSLSGLISSVKILISFEEYLIPPTLTPDSINNNLMGSVYIYYEAMNYWAENISSLEIVNSDIVLIPQNLFIIDNENLRIKIENVQFSNTNVPIFNNLFQIGYNEIIVHATHFQDASIMQEILPRQIIQVDSGLSNAQMRLCENGRYLLQGLLPSESTDYTINTTVYITVIEEYPKNNSTIGDLSSEIYVVFPETILSFDQSQISISDSSGSIITNVSAYVSPSNSKKLMITHPEFSALESYKVAIAENSIKLNSGFIDSEITWNFSCSSE